MSATARKAILLTGIAGVVALYLWGVGGLPRSGDYRGPYGTALVKVVVPERHVTDVVTAVNFDYRGIDTIGEEFILFASVVGVSLLLRRHAGETEERWQDEMAPERHAPPTSDAVRTLGLSLVGITVAFGLYVVTHGQLTPGGGFQGGVILATVPFLVYLAGDPRTFERVAPQRLVELGEAAGAAGFVLIGFAGVVAGAAYLQNVLPLGEVGSLTSGGTIPLISLATGLEVAGGFVLVIQTFLETALRRRLARGRRR